MENDFRTLKDHYMEMQGPDGEVVHFVKRAVEGYLFDFHQEITKKLDDIIDNAIFYQKSSVKIPADQLIDPKYSDHTIAAEYDGDPRWLNEEAWPIFKSLFMSQLCMTLAAQLKPKGYQTHADIDKAVLLIKL